MDLDWVFTGAIVFLILYILTGHEWVYYVALLVLIIAFGVVMAEIVFDSQSVTDKMEDPEPSPDTREHGPKWASF